MASIDFIYINQQAVRLTSFTRDQQSSRLSLIVIVRGNAARDELNALVAREPITVAFPDEEPAEMHLASVDLKTTGEGARSIHRFDLTLVAWANQANSDISPDATTDSAAESALMRRLDAIEQKLDQLTALVRDRLH
ncbi:MAG TPA: hypothetical protein VFQ54_08925 [Thermomicrobiales bacterium]|nr:hypothetical protein [Thermomicrobiales bacterium]